MICSKNLLIILSIFLLVLYFRNNKSSLNKIHKILNKKENQNTDSELSDLEKAIIIDESIEDKTNNFDDLEIKVNNKINFEYEGKIDTVQGKSFFGDLENDIINNDNDLDDDIFNYIHPDEKEVIRTEDEHIDSPEIPEIIDYEYELESPDKIVNDEEIFEINKENSKDLNIVDDKLNDSKIDDFTTYGSSDWRTLDNFPVFKKCKFKTQVPKIYKEEKSALNVNLKNDKTNLILGDKSIYGSNKIVDKNTQKMLEKLNKNLIKSGVYQYPEYSDNTLVEEANQTNSTLMPTLGESIKSQIKNSAAKNSTLRDTFEKSIINFKDYVDPEEKTKLVTSKLDDQLDESNFSYFDKNSNNDDNIGFNKYGSFSDYGNNKLIY
tara:strand:- start:720 stop:1856 length:1137 start_codon:yes stop_codon:yes gene_type:complete